ncbi:MAG: hypothetical protein Ta2A_15190 [Treponemataceae bacterium]|nr:MAG: hypothetical protein Ta2A_15190 [Treponemataceae bacterium]
MSEANSLSTVIAHNAVCVPLLAMWDCAKNNVPSLDWTPPLFRRRLSVISKLTIEVVHELLALAKAAHYGKADNRIDNRKIVFASRYGEVSAQYKINAMLCKTAEYADADGSLTPAVFSHSVSNTPPALATIANDMRAGYSAIYARNFRTALLAAMAPVLAGEEERIIFVWAHEKPQTEYATLALPCDDANSESFAFAALLASAKSMAHNGENVYMLKTDSLSETPREFAASVFASEKLLCETRQNDE